MEKEPEMLAGQKCPVCKKDTLTLTEQERDIPYFGKVLVFSMTCSECRFHKADVETAEQHDALRIEFDVEAENDLNVRVVKSSQATVKIPRMISMEPGAASQGFVTNVEGLLRRFKYILEQARDQAEDKTEQKKAKNMLRKLQKAMWGQEKLRLIIEDKTGNSAVVSDKAVIKKL